MIVEFQVTKFATKTYYKQSLALAIFLVKLCDTFKSYQVFDKVVDKFSVAKARKICPWN